MSTSRPLPSQHITPLVTGTEWVVEHDTFLHRTVLIEDSEWQDIIFHNGETVHMEYTVLPDGSITNLEVSV